jgi:K+-transporting ATPase ATPase C chain
MTLLVRLLRQSWVGLVVLAVFTVLLGVLYPVGIWAVSRIGSHAAEGSPLTVGGCVVGSEIIGVDTKAPEATPDPYFHARVVGATSPSSDPFAPGSPAAGAPSNQGPNSDTLKAWIDARRAAIAQREGVDPSAVPSDAVTGSGSGLDPDISPAYAEIQIKRVAKASGKSEDEVKSLVQAHTEGRQFGFLGEPRVNVPKLNAALGLHPQPCGA